MGLVLIKKEEINKNISQMHRIELDLETDGLYLIEIIASAKSWWQNWKSLKIFFNDDDLAVMIDDKGIAKEDNNKEKTATGWNGNELKALFKTLVVAIHLGKGKHSILLAPRQSPYVKYVRISKVEDANKITYIPEDNNPAENGDRRPWVTMAMVDLAISTIRITASADNRGRDDDDIKLMIDGETVMNEDVKAHKYWYWCGKIIKGKEKTWQRTIDSPKGTHLFELWADRMPMLHRFEATIKVAVEENRPRIPTKDDPKWTGDFNDDPEDILLARLIFGEARNQPHEAKVWIAWSVINRMEAGSWWPDNIRGVILQKGQYDPFKPVDKNYLAIIDPLGFDAAKEINRNAWNECYEIALAVIGRKTVNPTEATHFHGLGITVDWFMERFVPNGKFLKKIGDTCFYWSPN